MTTSAHNTFRRLSSKELVAQDLQLIAVVFQNDRGVWGTKRYHYYAPAEWQCAAGDKVCVEVLAGNRTVKVVGVFSNGPAIKRIKDSVIGFKTAKWVIERNPEPAIPAAPGNSYFDFVLKALSSAAYSQQINAYAYAQALRMSNESAPAVFLEEAFATNRIKNQEPASMNLTTFNRIKNQESATMNLTITHQTLINGQNVEHMSDAQLFSTIKNAQDEIANLEKISPDNRPRRLVKRIEELQAGIKALVTLLDERDAKSERKE